MWTAFGTSLHGPSWRACGNDPDCSHAEPLGYASALEQFKANRHCKGSPLSCAVFPPMPVHFLCRTASSATGSRLHGTRCDGVGHAESQFPPSCDYGVACLMTTDRHLASTLACLTGDTLDLSICRSSRMKLTEVNRPGRRWPGNHRD